MANERRAWDARISEMSEMIKEIHQRQQEVTLPCLKEHKDKIESLTMSVNDLLAEHTSCQNRVCEIEKKMAIFPKLLAGIGSFVIGFIATLEFIWRHK